MQSRAFIRTSPNVCRIVKSAPAPSRSMSLFSPAPFLVRGNGFPSNPFASLEREVAPFFRILEDLNRTFDHHFEAPTANARVAPAPFQPRFDVREVDGAYELRGELPGVESNNIDVEFTDAQTLVIRGRTGFETSSGTPSAELQQQTAKAVEAAEPTTTNAVADDAASTHSTASYQKASVEDEGAVESSASTTGPATPAESTTAEAQPQQQQQQVQTQAAPAVTSNANGNTPRYWVSERRTGSFQRVFNFPVKVDQEAVSASLKNGVLNVVVPKAVARAPRRIAVQ